MKKTIFLLFAYFLLCGALKAQDNFFLQYSTDDGLNDSFINSISQDDNGYLWIGTAEGLSRFDGFTFQNYSTEDGLSENYISKIFKDSKGVLWFGHRNGSVSLYSNDEFKQAESGSTGKGLLADMEEDEKGLIWLLFQNQGLYYVSSNLKLIEINHSVEYELFSSIKSIGENHLLLGTDERLTINLFDAAENKITEILEIDDLPSGTISDILKISENFYLLLTQDEGIYTLAIDSDKTEYELKLIDDNSDGNIDNLQDAITDSNGNIWVASMGGGLIKYGLNSNGNLYLIDHIKESNGLVSNNVKTSFEDFEGNLWLGLYGNGLLKHVDNNLSVISISDDPAANKIYSIFSDAESTWLLNNNYLLELKNTGDSIVSQIKLPSYLSSDLITSSFRSEDGRLWIGFESSGLYTTSVNNFKLQKVILSVDDLSNSINSITGDRINIWISTKKGAFRIDLKSGKKTEFNTVTHPGLSHNNIQQIYLDSKNRALLATLCSEINYIDENDEIGTIEKSRIGSMISVISILEGKDGNIYIATLGNGVWKLDLEGNLNFTRNSGLVSDFCYSMIESDNGRIIISHRGGISEINSSSNRIKTYGQLEGIKSSMEFYQNAILKNEEGIIRFGTSEGILRYDPLISATGDLPPLLQISNISIDGEIVKFDSIISLKPGQYELRIDYIGINFSSPEMVMYQSFLDGYNSSWSELSPDRQVIFDRIGHGKYTFNLRAFNENDTGTQITSAFKVHIQKPIYLTIWFYLVIATVISGLFYYIIREREKSHRSEQARLIKNLDEKSKDIIVKEEIIKERKKVEAVLIAAKTKAELAEQLKSSFLSNMSHEIRTPMNAIVGMSHLLKEDGSDPESRDELINEIISNSESLLTLISDILDVSKIETEQLTITSAPIEVNTIITKLYEKFSGELERINKAYIKLSVLASNEEVEIVSDSSRLEQILTKLIENAIKFTEKGKITFGYQINTINKTIIFFVEDTGIGLSESKKEFVFDLFRKIEDDKLKLYRGTGLGLTLARYLVKLLGGDINVESTEGKGSKFYFVLPLIHDQKHINVSEKEIKTIDPKYNWQGKKILIVEDDDINFVLLEHILLPTKIEIVRDINGESATERIKNKEHFDLIIMDIKLPGIDGYEATRQIRKLDKLIPIISHTAYAIDGDKEKSLEAGCNDYITKPTDNDLFLKTVDNRLRMNDGHIQI